MKITRYNINILRSETEILERDLVPLRERIDDWVAIVKEREEWGGTDNYIAQLRRAKLEEAINEFRQRLATIYDFMGDRGLGDFVPTPLREELNGGGPEPSRDSEDHGGGSPATTGEAMAGDVQEGTERGGIKPEEETEYGWNDLLY